MKKTINGKTYNTKTATLICERRAGWQHKLTPKLYLENVHQIYRNRQGDLFYFEHIEDETRGFTTVAGRYDTREDIRPITSRRQLEIMLDNGGYDFYGSIDDLWPEGETAA